MASFPNLSSGKPAMYPAMFAQEHRVVVNTFADGTEQRWRRRAPLSRWTLTYTDISAVDVATLWAFFNACKGAFDSTWDVTISGITYSYCCFDTDEFAVTESKPGRYNVTLVIRQVRKS